MIDEIKKNKHEALKKENQISDLSYKRLPKIHVYNDEGDVHGLPELDYIPEYENKKDLLHDVFQKLSSHNMLQIGDILTDGEDVSIVGLQGKLTEPLVADNYLVLPAWIFELGMKHKYSFDKMKLVYKKVPNASYFVYPLSMHGRKHFKAGVLESFLIHDTVYDRDLTIDQDGDHEDYLDDLFDYKLESIFLEYMKPAKSSEKKKSPPKSSPKSSPKSPPKSPLKSCVKQTTKKYTDRPSPPYPAADCPGDVKKGNNGKMYESVANVNGIYSWKLKK